MYSLSIVLCAVVAVSRAGVLAPAGHVTPVLAPAAHVAPVATRVDEYDPNPQYSFTYNVEDSHTGDSKSQHETRQGDVVQGAYSLVEPDGSRRTVEYTADSHNGFNAVVHREAGTHPVPVRPVYQAQVVARPVVQYSAPTVRLSTQAPYNTGNAYSATYQRQH